MSVFVRKRPQDRISLPILVSLAPLLLVKAKRGAAVAGHKYVTRRRGSDGLWRYTYASGESVPRLEKGDAWEIDSIEDTRSYDLDTGKPIPGTGDRRECDLCGAPHEIHVYAHAKKGGQSIVCGTSCIKKQPYSDRTDWLGGKGRLFHVYPHGYRDPSTGRIWHLITSVNRRGAVIDWYGKPANESAIGIDLERERDKGATIVMHEAASEPTDDPFTPPQAPQPEPPAAPPVAPERRAELPAANKIGAGRLTQARMEFSRSRVRWLLLKAKRGEMKVGHKYRSRRRNDQGEWIYDYGDGSANGGDGEQPENMEPPGVQFYATIDSDSIRDYMPATPSLFPVSSWVRKATFDGEGMVAGKIPPIKLPAHMRDEAVEKGADGGGFVAARVWGGEYKFSLGQYVDWLEGWKPTWAAMLDFCVEPAIASTPDAVRERQDKTTANAKDAWAKHKDAPWAWVPTVQGWTIDDYVRHARELKPQIAEMMQHYTDRAESGAMSPPGSPSGFRVGIGTLCCRTSRKQIAAIVRAVARELPGIPLHLWGVKLDLFKMHEALPDQVVSSDSAAWSMRFGADIEAYKESGLTQREHAYTVALPDYTKRVRAAQATPKQVVTEFGEETHDWSKLETPQDEKIAIFSCPACGTTMDEATWDAIEPEDRDDVRMHVEIGVCPACQAPLDAPDFADDLGERETDEFGTWLDDEAPKKQPKRTRVRAKEPKKEDPRKLEELRGKIFTERMF